MKTLKKILDETDEADILTDLCLLYPESIESIDGFINVIETLRKITPTEPQSMRIRVKRFKQVYRDYIHVSGINPSSPDDGYGSSGEDISWSLGFTPWDEWLAMDVEVYDFNDNEMNTFPKVLAHILWEMSWYGFDQDEIKNELDEIKSRMDELDEILENNTHEEAIEKGLLFEWDPEEIKKELDE